MYLQEDVATDLRLKLELSVKKGCRLIFMNEGFWKAFLDFTLHSQLHMSYATPKWNSLKSYIKFIAFYRWFYYSKRKTLSLGRT